MVSQKAQPFRHSSKTMLLTKISPQARHAETDPRHGTPTVANFQPPDLTAVYRFSGESSEQGFHRASKKMVARATVSQNPPKQKQEKQT